MLRRSVISSRDYPMVLKESSGVGYTDINITMRGHTKSFGPSKEIRAHSQNEGMSEIRFPFPAIMPDHLSKSAMQANPSMKKILRKWSNRTFYWVISLNKNMPTTQNCSPLPRLKMLISLLTIMNHLSTTRYLLKVSLTLKSTGGPTMEKPC